MFLSIDEITQRFPPPLVEAAQRLLEQGAIERVNIERGGELITAVVAGDGGPPLRPYIRVARAQDGPQIHGECGCDADGPCVHLVGVLLHALGEKGPAGGDPRAAPGNATASGAGASGSERPQRLLYTLHLEGGRLSVAICVARRLPQGGHELVSGFEPSRARGNTPARFLEPSDLELLRILDSAPLDPVTRHPILEGAESSRLFEKMLATQRCHFATFEGTAPLRSGTPRNIELYWQTDRYGCQQLTWRTSPAATMLLPLDDPWYLDQENGSCAPLQSPLSGAQLWQLLRLPPLQPDGIQAWWQSFQADHPASPIPVPRIYEQESLPPTPPRPCLHLSGDDSGRHHASLSFVYAGFEVAPDSPATRLHNGRLIRLVRDEAIEGAAAAWLIDLGLEASGVDALAGRRFVPAAHFPQTVEQAWIVFQQQALPQLRAQGWRITFERFRHRLVEADRWTGHIGRLERKDWFALSLDLEVEGRRIELLPLLLQLLDTLPPQRQEMEQIIGRDLLLPLEDVDGNPCLLRLPGARALQILELLLEVCGNAPAAGERPIEINRAQLARLASLDANDDSDIGQAPIHWSDEESRQLAERLRNLECLPPCAPPASLRASLRPYQQQGLDWLQFLREYRLGGILADDMGLGKTLQTLAHLLLEKASGRADRPSLVVVPTSLTFNWLREARRFAPELKLLLLHGAQRKSRFKQLHAYDLVITTYPLLARDSEALSAQDYHLLILDEAQTIKNPKSQASRLVRGLDARHRLCLTGTPLENHLGELWSLFDFLMPGLLGDSRQFRRDYRLPIETHSDPGVAVRLSRRLRPFLLRRTKQQVAKELPEKIEIVQSVALEGAQRELYETVRLSLHRRVREEIQRLGLARSRILVLDALMKLRQVCCDPRLIKNENTRITHESAKLSHLMALLTEMIEEGRRILLFSQFTSMLALIEDEVLRAGIPYVKLTGATRDRETPVKRFQQGEIPLFLISLKAGGVGLNLTAADTVIHYDPWWNPAVERQATDRSHRIGQQQQVFVYKLICEGTLEEKILAMQQRKQRLADNLFQSNDSGDLQWSEEDIDALFSPLRE